MFGNDHYCRPRRNQPIDQRDQVQFLETTGREEEDDPMRKMWMETSTLNLVGLGVKDKEDTEGHMVLASKVGRRLLNESDQ